MAIYLNEDYWGDWERDSSDKRLITTTLERENTGSDFEDLLDLGLIYRITKIYSIGACSTRTTLYYIPIHVFNYLEEIWANPLHLMDPNHEQKQEHDRILALNVDRSSEPITRLQNAYICDGIDGLADVVILRNNPPLATNKLSDIVSSAKQKILVQDRYISFDVIAYLSQVPRDVKKRILTYRKHRRLEQIEGKTDWVRIIKRWDKEIKPIPNLEIRVLYKESNPANPMSQYGEFDFYGEDTFHSRFICIDNTLWKLDNSIKDFGKGTLTEMRRLSDGEAELYLTDFEDFWKIAEKYDPNKDRSLAI